MNEDYHEDFDDSPADKNGNDATEGFFFTLIKRPKFNPVATSTSTSAPAPHFSWAKSLSSSLLDFIQTFF